MKLFRFVLLVLILSVFNSNAQQIIGKVVESENNFELNNVTFTSKKNNQIFVSDTNGEIILPTQGTYLINKKGYKPSEITLTTNKYFIVELNILATSLDEIVIKGTNFKKKLIQTAPSVSLIPKNKFTENTTILSNIINTIPGVFMHAGTYTTNRITIRGIGSRNLYGTSKIRVYYNDIPLTNGSGESSVEDVELASLGSIEIHKGPATTTFGSGLGGAIQLIPHKGFFKENTFNSQLNIGAFGLQKYLAQIKLGNATNSSNIIYSNFHSNGHRDNNTTDKESITIASKHFLNAKNSLTFFGNYIDLKGFIPSSLNEDDYLNEPTSAAFTWSQAKGFEATKKGIIGLAWKHNYNASTTQTTNVFYSNFDTYEARPFNILKEKTTGWGIRTKLNLKSTLFNTKVNWIIGGEYFNDKKSYGTFTNLYKDNLELGSVEGERLSNWIENRDYFNLFIDSKFNLSSKTQLTVGLNANNTTYSLKDKFNETAENKSGDYNFDLKLSPSIAITQHLSSDNILFGNISHGFSNPTLEEILLPSNEINTSIKPEEGWNFEIGNRGKILNNKIHYSIALFQMNVKNLLVAKRINEDQYVGVNAGKTNYKGLELSVNYSIAKNNSIHITQSHNSSINNYKFKEFVDFDQNYSGNKLPGVPSFTYNSEINFETTNGFFARIKYNYIGEMKLRDDNILSTKPNQLVNSTMGYNLKISNSFNAKIFITGNNIFNQKYASMLLINASSFGNSKPRYFYPGEPINFNGGIHLNYKLN